MPSNLFLLWLSNYSLRCIYLHITITHNILGKIDMIIFSANGGLWMAKIGCYTFSVKWKIPRKGLDDDKWLKCCYHCLLWPTPLWPISIKQKEPILGGHRLLSIGMQPCRNSTGCGIMSHCTQQTFIQWVNPLRILGAQWFPSYQISFRKSHRTLTLL